MLLTVGPDLILDLAGKGDGRSEHVMFDFVGDFPGLSERHERNSLPAVNIVSEGKVAETKDTTQK